MKPGTWRRPGRCERVLLRISGKLSDKTLRGPALEIGFGRRVIAGRTAKISGRVYPPPPHTSESLDWRGLYKNGLQNIEPQGFRGQNLDNNRLAAFLAVAVCSASALTMFCSLACGWQG